MLIDISKSAPDWVHEAFRRSPPSEGGFSVVAPLNAFQVIKVTSCPATNELLAELLCMTKVPWGLPVVFKSLGEVGRISGSDTPASGWVLERLFSGSSPEDSLRWARATGASAVRSRRPPQPVFKRLRPSPSLPEEISLVFNESYHTEPARKCFLGMASLVDEELQPAFTTLALLSATRPAWTADLGVPNNIMLDMFGGAVLADPVYNFHECQSRLAKGAALGILVPVRLRGGQVLVRPAVLPCGSPARLCREKLEQLDRLGLRPLKTFPIFGKDHLSFIEEGPRWVDAAPFGPDVRQNLLQDRYSSFLAQALS